jgi:anaerobic selenocysteine-containing dehydrogenase
LAGIVTRCGSLFRWCSCRGHSCAGSTRNSNFSVRPPIVVHPTTPPAAGVSDDQRLIVRNAQHELTGIARVDASVRRGAVAVPHGHARANVNLLNKLLNKQGRHRPGHRDDALLRRAGQPAPGVTLLRGDLVRLDGNKWTPRQS